MRLVIAKHSMRIEMTLNETEITFCWNLHGQLKTGEDLEIVIVSGIIFKNGTVNNFYEFFETFKDRNIFKDAQLAELVEQPNISLFSIDLIF